MSSTGPNYARKLHLVIPCEILAFSQWSLVDTRRQVRVHSRDSRKRSYPAMDSYLSTSIYSTAL
eukprot:14842309-Ditylum_brightwellii.AAC.1